MQRDAMAIGLFGHCDLVFHETEFDNTDSVNSSKIRKGKHIKGAVLTHCQARAGAKKNIKPALALRQLQTAGFADRGGVCYLVNILTIPFCSTV